MRFYIKEAREKAGYTQKELAELIGVAPNTFHGYESGKHDPKSDLLVKIATACHVSVDYLLGVRSLGASVPSSGESGRPKMDAPNKKAPSKKDEADEILERYRALDEHGQGAVNAILNFEHAAVIAEKRQSPASIRPGLKVIKRSDGFIETKVYDQPSAAGLGNYLDDPAFHIEQYPANVIPDGTDFGIRISGDSMSPEYPNGCTAFVQSRSTIELGKIGIFLVNGEAFCKKLAVDREKSQVRLVSLNSAYEDRIIEEFDEFRTIGLVLGHWPK